VRAHHQNQQHTSSLDERLRFEHVFQRVFRGARRQLCSKLCPNTWFSACAPDLNPAEDLNASSKRMSAPLAAKGENGVHPVHAA